jgi:hypothetical protein
MKGCIKWVVCCLIGLNFGVAWGDVLIESTYKTSGIKGMGEAEGTSSQRFQSEKKWESQTTRFTGAILSRMVGESANVTITRVDKGVAWILDTKKKTYQENPLVLPKSKSEEREPREGKEGKPTTRISRSEFTVKKTGASETINGFPCEEYLITWLLEMEDLETKSKTRSTMMTSLWTTPETPVIRKVREEESVYNKALAKKMGMDLSPDEAKKMGMAAMGGLMKASSEEMQKGMIRVKNEMAKIQGYPIRTIINWNMEGEKGGPGSQEERPAKADRGEGIGGLLGGLMGKLTPKKAEDKGSGQEGSGAPFFSTTLEIKSLGVDSLPGEQFEIPPGYVKK